MSAAASCTGYYDGNGQLRANGIAGFTTKVRDDNFRVDSSIGCGGGDFRTNYTATCIAYGIGPITVQLIDDGGKTSEVYTLQNPCTPGTLLPSGQMLNMSF